jgi:hypothetical protein
MISNNNNNTTTTNINIKTTKIKPEINVSQE